jgi:hypothetical protein
MLSESRRTVEDASLPVSTLPIATIALNDFSPALPVLGK